MDALQSMERYLSTRPTRFPSLASGIEWQYAIPAVFNRPQNAHLFAVPVRGQFETQPQPEPQFHL